MRFSCNYAQAGTYSHECGKPAAYALPLHSERNPTGVYYARRCESCKDKLEPAERPISGLVAFNHALHANL